MADINLERVKQYNTECNAYRQKLSQIRAERKILMDSINSQCAQLSKQLGIEVTIDNIEKIYQDRASSIENILEAGEGILRRIKNSGEDNRGVGTVGEGAEVAGLNTQVGTSGQGAVMPGAGTPGVARQGVGTAGVTVGNNTGFANGVQQVNNGATGINGLPVSNYKMPNNFVNGQLGGNNPFIAQSIFSGNMKSIDVAATNDECLGVDEI